MRSRRTYGEDFQLSNGTFKDQYQRLRINLQERCLHEKGSCGIEPNSQLNATIPQYPGFSIRINSDPFSPGPITEIVFKIH